MHASEPNERSVAHCLNPIYGVFRHLVRRLAPARTPETSTINVSIVSLTFPAVHQKKVTAGVESGRGRASCDGTSAVAEKPGLVSAARVHRLAGENRAQPESPEFWST